MNKFLIGLIAGVAVTIAVNETLKSDRAQGTIEAARKRIYDAIGELVDKIDPDVTQ